MPKGASKVSRQLSKKRKENDFRTPYKRKAVIMFLLAISVAMMGANLWKDVGQLVLSPTEDSRKTAVVESSRQTEVSTPEEPSKENPFEKRRKLAREELARLEAEGVMTTNFSKRETVKRAGFPWVWSPCVVERAYQQTPQLGIAVLGGSMVARAGDDCVDENPEIDGRYSGLLQRKLHADLDIRVENWGEGATSSLTRALRLDGVINPLETRIVFVDFLINDNADAVRAGGGDNLWIARKLDLFLTRLKSHYALAQQPPPAVALIYHWQAHGDYLIPSLPIIESYRQLRWEIALVSVWPAFDKATIEGDFIATLMDDGIHPKCAVTHLLADMLQHLLYSNLAECEADSLQQKTYSLLLPPHEESWASANAPYPALWKDLFREDAKIGSISPWEPRPTTYITTLNMENLNEVSSWPSDIQSIISPGRLDRKIGFVIPECTTPDSGLHFNLSEPDLAWIGLGVPWGRNVLVTVNDEAYNTEEYAQENWGAGLTHLSHWLPIQGEKADMYSVKICARVGDPPAFLHHFIGVSVPK